MARLGCRRSTFKDLPHVHRERRIAPAPQRRGGHDRWIGRPSAHYELCVLKGRHDGFGTHLRDDVRRAIDFGDAQRTRQLEFGHRAFRQTSCQPRGVDVARDHRGGEPESALAQDLVHDVQEPRQVRPRAAAARRADDHGKVSIVRGGEDQREVALDHRAVCERHSRAEIVRARIGGARIDGDHLRIHRHPARERGFGDAVSEHAARCEDAERVLASCRRRTKHGPRTREPGGGISSTVRAAARRTRRYRPDHRTTPGGGASP